MTRQDADKLCAELNGRARRNRWPWGYEVAETAAQPFQALQLTPEPPKFGGFYVRKVK